MTGVDDADEWLGTSADDTDTIVLHRFFNKHTNKIGKDLLSQGKFSIDEDNIAGGKKAWDDLCTALVDIGEPLEVPQLSQDSRAEHKDYLDLMARFAHRNTDHMRDIFVDTGMPEVQLSLYFDVCDLIPLQDQPAVFVLRVCNIDVEALDIELFMYHILKVNHVLRGDFVVYLLF